MEKTHSRRARKFYPVPPRKPAPRSPAPELAPYLLHEVPLDLASLDLSPLLRYALCDGALDYFYEVLVNRTAMPGESLPDALEDSYEETYMLAAHCLRLGLNLVAMQEGHWRQSPHFKQWKQHPIASQYARD